MIMNESYRQLLCFVIPYFGKLSHTMDIFLQTIKYNPNFTWLLFTDDNTEYSYPDNVIVNYCSFTQFRERIQSCFDFEISLPKPFKLCDYRPAYGYIFREELKNFDYWGYCDTDQFFGNLSSWLTKEYLENYDRLFGSGHMTIYRNCLKTNSLFMNDDVRENLIFSNYKQIFSSPENQAFDEISPNKVNINYLAKQASLRQSNDCFFLDVVPFKSKFIESYFYPSELRWSSPEKPIDFIILWDEGNLYKIEIINEKIQKKAAIYAHLQKRNLEICGNNKFVSFVIIPNRIILSSTSFTDLQLSRYVKISKRRSIFKIDEINHWKKNKQHLYYHRMNKLKEMLIETKNILFSNS